MRIPSIHLLKTDLEALINKYHQIDLNNLDQVLYDARKLTAEHRGVYATTKKTGNAVLKRTSSTIGDANLLADIIYSVRVRMKHIGVFKIKQTDNQWGNIKELSSIINEFCESNEMEIREGYIRFVTIGISLITKQNKPNYNFLAKWLIQKSSVIFAEFQASREVGSDNNPIGTTQIHDIYVNEVASRTGIFNTYHHDPTQMLNFIRARDLADTLKTPYRSFIEAQFYALEFCNGIPRVQDLAGDKARERVIKWLSENNCSVEQNNQDDIKPRVDWNQFKK